MTPRPGAGAGIQLLRFSRDDSSGSRQLPAARSPGANSEQNPLSLFLAAAQGKVNKFSFRPIATAHGGPASPHWLGPPRDPHAPDRGLRPGPGVSSLGPSSSFSSRSRSPLCPGPRSSRPAGAPRPRGRRPDCFPGSLQPSSSSPGVVAQRDFVQSSRTGRTACHLGTHHVFMHTPEHAPRTRPTRL